MRIVKEINDYPCKITLMEYAGHLYVKFESGMAEITVKFRQGTQIDHPEALEKLVKNHLADKISHQLESIKTLVATSMRAETPADEDDFEEII